MNLVMLNARKLSSEESLAELLEEVAGNKWDVIGLSEVRTDEAYSAK